MTSRFKLVVSDSESDQNKKDKALAHLDALLLLPSVYIRRAWEVHKFHSDVSVNQITSRSLPLLCPPTEVNETLIHIYHVPAPIFPNKSQQE